MSYPTTLGFAPVVSCESEWTTAKGKAELLRLVRDALLRVARRVDCEAPAVSLAWDAELERTLQRTYIPPGAPLRPTPPEVAQLAERMALTYVMRNRMHDRLDAMRRRTSVALTPHGEADDADATELRRALPPNSAYLKFRQQQERLRTGVRDSPVVGPPTRDLPGASK